MEGGFDFGKSEFCLFFLGLYVSDVLFVDQPAIGIQLFDIEQEEA